MDEPSLLDTVRLRDTLLLARDLRTARRSVVAIGYDLHRRQVAHFAPLLAGAITALLAHKCPLCAGPLAALTDDSGTVECPECCEQFATVDGAFTHVCGCIDCNTVMPNAALDDDYRCEDCAGDVEKRRFTRSVDYSVTAGEAA